MCDRADKEMTRLNRFYITKVY